MKQNQRNKIGNSEWHELLYRGRSHIDNPEKFDYIVILLLLRTKPRKDFRHSRGGISDEDASATFTEYDTGDESKSNRAVYYGCLVRWDFCVNTILEVLTHVGHWSKCRKAPLFVLDSQFWTLLTILRDLWIRRARASAKSRDFETLRNAQIDQAMRSLTEAAVQALREILFLLVPFAQLMELHYRQPPQFRH